MLKQAIDEGKAARSSQMLLDEAERGSLGLETPVIGWSGQKLKGFCRRAREVMMFSSGVSYGAKQTH